MQKVPVSLIIDDPAPLISVYYHHHTPRITQDGRPLPEMFPNSFLEAFCQTVERHGIKGKFSVVPMPGNQGDIVNGLRGVVPEDLTWWLDTVKTRLAPHFAIGPEMLTHNKAVDLATGADLALNEMQWAATQDRSGLTPYIARALQLLKDAGFDAFGVTSPWTFGLAAEEEYAAAISKAVYEVTGRTNAWYFLRGLRDTPNAKPWVQLEEDGRCLVSIPATTNDHCWASIENPDTSEEFVCRQADLLITEDGKEGEVIRVLETGGYPVLIAHWQSLFSNGLCTGLRIMDEVAGRINRHLSHRVEWMSFAQILDMVVADKESYPKPDFGC